MREITYKEAIREGLREEMRRDERIFVMGEDVAAYGGLFKVTEGLLAEFGPERVLDTPLRKRMTSWQRTCDSDRIIIGVEGHCGKKTLLDRPVG